jgi:hypothetical protein
MESGFVFSAASDDETAEGEGDVDDVLVLVADADAADDARPSSIRDETIRNNATANEDRKGAKYQEWYTLALLLVLVAVLLLLLLSLLLRQRFPTLFVFFCDMICGICCSVSVLVWVSTM